MWVSAECTWMRRDPNAGGRGQMAHTKPLSEQRVCYMDTQTHTHMPYYETANVRRLCTAAVHTQMFGETNLYRQMSYVNVTQSCLHDFRGHDVDLHSFSGDLL